MIIMDTLQCEITPVCTVDIACNLAQVSKKKVDDVLVCEELVARRPQSC